MFEGYKQENPVFGINLTSKKRHSTLYVQRHPMDFGGKTVSYNGERFFDLLRKIDRIA